jgi:hypothetical protein
MNTANAKPKPSRKQRVHELYNQAGAEEAFTFGSRLQLKPSTLHSWIGSWRREAAKAKTARTRDRTAKRKTRGAEDDRTGTHDRGAGGGATMTPRYPDIKVKLVGEDGNAFAIMGRAAKALRRHGIDGAEIDQFLTECRSGD